MRSLLPDLKMVVIEATLHRLRKTPLFSDWLKTIVKGIDNDALYALMK